RAPDALKQCQPKPPSLLPASKSPSSLSFPGSKEKQAAFIKGRLWFFRETNYWSRRLSTGRSSSFLSPFVLSLDEAVRRSVGLLGLLESSSLCRFSMAARRALTSLNSDVVSMYCSREGRIVAISACDFWIRSGVCG